MAPIAPTAIPDRVAHALREASRRTGEGFGYLLNTALRESGLETRAQAPTSSAAGLFQFVEQTWLESVKEWGPRHGLQSFAEDIQRRPDGRYDVADRDARQAILALREDPEISALMAGELARANRGELARRLGRAPSQGELYIGHFLGAAGGARLIEAAANAPDRRAAAMFPTAAKSNRPIFYDPTGAPRGAGAVYAELMRAHGGSSARPQPTRTAARTPFAGVVAFFERLFAGAPGAASPPRPAPTIRPAAGGAGERAAALTAASAYRAQAARMPDKPAAPGRAQMSPPEEPASPMHALLRSALWFESLFTTSRRTSALHQGLGLRRSI